MPRPQFEQVVAQVPKIEFYTFDYDSSLVTFPPGVETINPGGSATTDVTAPGANRIVNLTNLLIYIPAPAGATSGTHEIEVCDSSGNLSYIKNRCAYNGVIWFAFNEWLSTNIDGGTAKYPKDGSTVQQVRSIHYDDNIGLRFIYRNNTNVGFNRKTQPIKYRYNAVKKEVRK